MRSTQAAAATASTLPFFIIIIFLEKREGGGRGGRGGKREEKKEREREKSGAISVSFSNPVLVQEFNYTYFHHFLYSDILIKDALIQLPSTVGLACKNILPFLCK